MPIRIWPFALLAISSQRPPPWMGRR